MKGTFCLHKVSSRYAPSPLRGRSTTTPNDLTLPAVSQALGSMLVRIQRSTNRKQRHCPEETYHLQGKCVNTTPTERPLTAMPPFPRWVLWQITRTVTLGLVASVDHACGGQWQHPLNISLAPDFKQEVQQILTRSLTPFFNRSHVVSKRNSSDDIKNSPPSPSQWEQEWDFNRTP